MAVSNGTLGEDMGARDGADRTTMSQWPKVEEDGNGVDAGVLDFISLAQTNCHGCSTAVAISGQVSDVIFGQLQLLSCMPFKRFVEIGRVALVNYGKDYGRLVVIVDVVDQNRALVDAPDMVRCQMNFKRLSLTDIKIDIKRIPKKATLIKAMEEADVKTKWENSSWGKKLVVQKRRASLNDFDRFKVMLAKIKFFTCLPCHFSYEQRGGAIRQELAKLKKEVAA
ncbi:unnamed protein product [Triticum turgidum subsp. durum]|uniref:Large ribosomal subunit protein eL14 domain-containing protein n=1 Tax=Triticum turgidum subsp. durum TaxID=4567 RepID=A0A9R0Y2W6_TRITD|nr:unnamed protein product [Triticum turgidum subsp. durum]